MQLFSMISTDKSNRSIAVLNSSKDENLTMLDYEFFSYDIVDHRTLLLRFDMTQTLLFQETPFTYDASLYISKIPMINSKIRIGQFSGFFETEIDATIIDHLTLCLILVSSENETKTNRSFSSRRISNAYEKFLLQTIEQQQQHIVHYCTKLGPDEDRHRHRLKQGTGGDHVLLVLQLFMIGLFLIVLQIVHTLRDRRIKEWRHRQLNKLRRDSWFRKKYSQTSDEGALDSLPFRSIVDLKNEEVDNDEEKETSSLLLCEPCSSPSTSFDLERIDSDTMAIEHILSVKPWPRLSVSHNL